MGKDCGWDSFARHGPNLLEGAKRTEKHVKEDNHKQATGGFLCIEGDMFLSSS